MVASDRQWLARASEKIEADFCRSSDTHLLPVALPMCPGIRLYLKDESCHVTGSLKHRLARSLFLHALVNGHIHDGTTVVEASSGSTAISEAYFARLLGLPYVAVMPASTSADKIALIEAQGGRCHLVDDGATVYAVAQQLAEDVDGYYMDQFTNAERATDWRGNNNIAEKIFEQMSREAHPVPRWIVVGAGTGGTASTIGRFIRFRGYSTQLCVVDPQHSVTFDYFRTGDATLRLDRGSGVEGIGRPRVEPSFVRTVVDQMIKVPDEASYAAMLFLYKLMAKRAGPSTGTNLWGAFELIADMIAAKEEGSIVSLICDSGERYSQTYYDDVWLARRKIDLRRWRRQLQAFVETGEWPERQPRAWRQPDARGLPALVPETMTKILLIEDNEMNRDMLSRRLAMRGFDVVVAIDGSSGAAAAATEQPDLILMDVSLPDMDGFEVTRLLRSQPATASIPVIALTAHTMETDRLRAADAGCQDYDTKPVDLTRLLAKITALLPEDRRAPCP